MTRDQVVAVVRRNISQVLPDVDSARLASARSLTELGANSIDRLDVVVGALADLDLEVPGRTLAAARDIESLVDVLWERVTAEDR